MPQQTPFEKTVELIDAANREDPNMEAAVVSLSPKSCSMESGCRT